MTDKLTQRERLEVEHWRKWLANGGKRLNIANTALSDLVEIIDRIAPRSSVSQQETKT